MKQFETAHSVEYYKNWIYLGTAGKKDFYLRELPNSQNPYPSTSIVYGVNPEDYISTTMPVPDILNESRVWDIMLYLLRNPSTDIYMHLIAFIREYASKLNTH